ncbi:MAG: rhodanese-like domain-containing protein [Melioribacteraceae bacterium]|nr:rhodanese-like domain-containing protein [Melioribacteraceae bacterium]
MNIRKLFYLLLILPILFVGCKKEDVTEPTPQINEAEELIKYLEANGDYLNTAAPAVTDAATLYADIQSKPDKIHVIDIRTQADYETKGHISGAIRVDQKNIVTYMKGLTNWSSYEKIVIACYSGQQAGMCVALLRMLGYNNVSSLKFGMSAWNASCATSWNQGTGFGNNYTNFVTTPVDKPAAGNLPTIKTGKTTGKEILEARINELLATTSALPFDDIKIAWNTVTGNLSNYFIMNYWTKTDYDKGHLPGAIQYTPKSDLKLSTFLKTLPTNKTIVVYCYTGQTSANVATILKIMGYDAKSLLYGVNIMNYDWMKNNGISNWFNPASDVKAYPFVTGPNPK